jgi:hypothetical protein
MGFLYFSIVGKWGNEGGKREKWGGKQGCRNAKLQGGTFVN